MTADIARDTAVMKINSPPLDVSIRYELALSANAVAKKLRTAIINRSARTGSFPIPDAIPKMITCIRIVIVKGAMSNRFMRYSFLYPLWRTWHIIAIHCLWRILVTRIKFRVLKLCRT